MLLSPLMRWLGAPLAGLCLSAPVAAAGPSPTPWREGTPEAIQAFVAAQHKDVLTFVGYSGAGYEDPQAMLAQADRVLAAHDPAKTLVNIGATEVGIGAVYALARQRGFVTMGIVSSLARDEGVPLSPQVQHVFFVEDAHWGGRLPGSDRLSPTSAAMVAASTWVVGLGGGDAARDELLEARARGLDVQFFPADMHHDTARRKAQAKGLPAPTDFRGAAHAALTAAR